MCTNQKQVMKMFIIKNIRQKQVGLNELSISTIKQKLPYENSFSYFEQNQLLDRIHQSFDQVIDQYGFYKNTPYKIILKNQFKTSRNEKNYCKYNFTDTTKVQNFSCSLQFNKDLKRKKSSFKSKEKVISPTISRSLNYLSQSKDKLISIQNIQNIKKIQAVISPSPKIILKIDSILKTPQIALKINQPSILNIRSHVQNKNFLKLYHQPPGDIKIQLYDLNYNLKTEDYKEFTNIFTQTKKAKSLVFNQKKVSRFLNSEKMVVNRQKQPVNVLYLKPKQEYKRVVDVSKTLSLECKSTSVYSSRTSDYQSPISKESCSTAVYRTVKRSQKTPNTLKNNYQYFRL